MAMPPDREQEIARISDAMGRLRVLIGRRVIGRRVLDRVAPMLDLSDLDVLGLVPAQDGGEEVSVGDIARVLRIHPSRASRLVAELVEKGFLLRAVSQRDARRAVLLRSDSGNRICTEIRQMKREVIGEIVGDWPEADLADFARAFETFILSWEERLTPPS
ncbi:MarR family transcriptional regulator [Sinirhodobacter populi]|uniref:MarR family transcriptional regulator n=2 Tax=Paenirhodobacter populi TaxID=2306993 RepID=A0A443JSV2_9RHOB|nr:MarR family transcriptional regulator [Sinirhodobacter populi]RWR23563.1 MarR family transcriptional regulator [Sinirhodobacter populi]